MGVLPQGTSPPLVLAGTPKVTMEQPLVQPSTEGGFTSSASAKPAVSLEHDRKQQLNQEPKSAQDQVPLQQKFQTGDSISMQTMDAPMPSESQFPSRIFLDVCSGSTRPLSTAILAQGGDVCSIDILRCTEYDLLDDSFFLKLLRICASGRVAYIACSPSCNEYSVLKLKPGGPPPLRSREHLAGFPHLSADDLTKVQNSHTMLARCCELLQVVFSAGGHGHLEQPPSAMSWLESCTQQWLTSGGFYCINLAACAFGRDWPKSWLFASSFQPLTAMACTCPHQPGHHQKLAGVRDASGGFMSRRTAEYPEQLAQQFASIVIPLVTGSAIDFSVENLLQSLPRKGTWDQPTSNVDGAGFHSRPDWSHPNSIKTDTFKDFRQHWMQQICILKLHKEIATHFSQQRPEPPFTDDLVNQMRSSIEQFLAAHNVHTDWTIPPNQPLCLHVLQALSRVMQDPDIELFQHLIDGVPTGYLRNIPPSHCFEQTADTDDEPPPLSVHFDAWKSAHDDPAITTELVEEEIKQGWVYEFPGTLEEAQTAFPIGVSVGKLGVATSSSRPPRLVVDSSVCGLNQNCPLPERGSLPSAKDLIRSYPLRNTSSPVSGLSLDVKSAHKRVAIRPSEQGLVGFSWQGKLYFYRVCPFGATFSAHWWSRLGGFLLRLSHRLLFLPHIGLLYVDDFIFVQEAKVLPISAAFLVLFFRAINLPISWKKCELSHTITWIGWKFNFYSGLVSVHPDKQTKLMGLIASLLKHTRVPLKVIQKVVGLAMWITQIFPLMRIWLHHLYMDMHKIPATQFSVDPGYWHEMVACLDTDLTFHSRPPGTAIPIGGKLIEVRHRKVLTIEDVPSSLLSERRVWLRIRDPTSTRRILGPGSIRTLHMLSTWMSRMAPVRSIWPATTINFFAAADACAHDQMTQIGGFINLPQRTI